MIKDACQLTYSFVSVKLASFYQVKDDFVPQYSTV